MSTGGRSLAPLRFSAEMFEERSRRAREIARALGHAHPDARCALDFRSPFELLVAVILSAQTTDVKVNEVLPSLRRRYPDAAHLAAAEPAALEAILRPLGFFRSKARALREMAQSLLDDHGGQVPSDMEALVRLRGVGRKTANVVLGECFTTAGVTVDTHVGRLSRRMGLTVETDPVRVERDLMALLPREDWTPFAHRMIWHGRRVCSARTPQCAICTVLSLCPEGAKRVAQ